MAGVPRPGPVTVARWVWDGSSTGLSDMFATSWGGDGVVAVCVLGVVAVGVALAVPGDEVDISIDPPATAPWPGASVRVTRTLRSRQRRIGRSTPNHEAQERAAVANVATADTGRRRPGVDDPDCAVYGRHVPDVEVVAPPSDGS